MIPGNALSHQPMPAPFAEPVNDPAVPLVDVEMGSLALNDPTGGLLQKLWTAYMDGDQVMVKADGVVPVALFERAGIAMLSLALDQNMRPFIAFVDGAGAHYWWFDPTAAAVVIADLPEGAQYPRCTLDDKRPGQVSSSDIILSYIRAGNLYYCQQRDRFATEYLLAAGVSLLQILGMGNQSRLQWQYASSGTTVFVCTLNGGKPKWSRYMFPWGIEAFSQLGNSLYVRHGDEVSIVDEDAATDDVEGIPMPFPGTVQWPWMDSGAPGVTKMMESIDYVGTGQGPKLSVGYDQRDVTAFTEPYQLDDDTLPGSPIPLPIAAPTFSIKLDFAGGQPWSVNAVTLNLDNLGGQP